MLSTDLKTNEKDNVKMRTDKMFRKRERLDTISGYLFLSPAILSFTIFLLIPIIMTFIMPFFEYNLVQKPSFTGWYNFKEFIDNKNTITVFGNTFKFMIILIPIHCILGLLLAYFVHAIHFSKLRNLFRGIIYFPSMVTTATVAIAFAYMFSTDSGFINYFLRQLGFEPVRWLTDPTIAYITIAIFSFWKYIGVAFLYYFIGLNNIPSGLYEAAKIDGAQPFSIFTKITMPLLTPTIFFVFITTTISVFQIFDEPYFITDGGPGISTTTVALEIYKVAFKQNNLGQGSTIALGLFILILITTLFQLKAQKKWAIYDYE